MYRFRDGWRVTWRDAGRRRSKFFHERDKARRFELELELGTAKTDDAVSPTFGEYADEWFRKYCKMEKAESQWRTDEIAIRLHLKPALGDTRLNQLRRTHLLTLKDQLRAKTAHGKRHALKPKSMNLIVALAKKITATAVERELIPTNPFAGVKLERLAPPRYRFWTVGEREQFLARAEDVDPEFCRLVLVACHTGLRLGELAALTKDDLDFERRKIRVSKTFDVNLVKLMATTKGRLDADVPMNSAVYEALTPARFIKPGTLVFNRALFWSARKRLGRLAKVADVSEIRFHDLRHTFASTLAMAGVDLMEIQKLMRHRSYAMTLHYAHLHPDHMEGRTEAIVVAQTAHKPPAAEKTGGPRGT